MAQDYYELLGISKNASKDEIKKAFRKKAQQYHPDKQDGDECKFKEVNEAYTTLSNDQKRAQYDQFGSAAPGGMGGGAGAQGFGGFGGFGQAGGMEFDMNDIFDMFGLGTIQRQAICPECSGTGRIPESACGVCRGSGAEHGQEEVNIKIPAGIEDGQQLRLSGRGEFMQGGENGDLYVLVRVVQDKRFEKLGNDLKTEKSISVTQAVLGDAVSVDTVDSTVKIKVPAGTNHGTLLKVKEQGVGEKKSKRGNLYVQIAIDIPKKLSKEEKKLFEQLHNL